ncbi:MAG: hypothetical protein AMXMBFR47_18700 [Planctomycetota bacterium]
MLILRMETLRLPKRRIGRARERFWREWCFWRTVARRFRSRVLLVATVLALGTAAFMQLGPERTHDPVDALYATWLLVFANPTEDFPHHPLLRVLFFLLPVMGLVLIIEVIVQLAMMVRDRRTAERSWCVTMASSMRNHIVLVGLGRLGYRTFRVLRALGEPVVVIERDEAREFVEAVRRDGSPLIIADARHDESLVAANVAEARSIITCTNDDLGNLEVALDARRMNPHIRVVLRMFDQNVADKVRDGFNIRIAMSQTALAAPTFALAAVDPTIVGTLVVDDQLLIQQRWQVHPQSELAGKTIGEVLETLGFSVLQQKTSGNASRLFPPPSQKLAAGDHLLVQGPYDALLRLRKRGASFA